MTLQTKNKKKNNVTETCSVKIYCVENFEIVIAGETFNGSRDQRDQIGCRKQQDMPKTTSTIIASMQ